MFFTPLFVLFCSPVFRIAPSFAEDDMQQFDWRIRLLIVTGGEIQDGHLRLYRTARGVKFPAKMLSVENEDQEIPRILEAIREDPFRPTDVVVVVKSEDYIVAGEPALASWKIALETLKAEAGVILSYPDTSSPNKRLRDKIKDAEEALQTYRATPRSAVIPYSVEGLQEAQALLENIRKLEVEESQFFRGLKLSPNAKDFRAYAFAGMASVVGELLEALREREKFGSVSEMWHSVVESASLRHRYAVSLDDEHRIFQDVRSITSDSYSYWKGHTNEVFLHATGEVIAPFLYAKGSEMPFLPANIMTKEVGLQEVCQDCPDEALPVGTTLDELDIPNMQVIVLLDHEVPFVRLFFQYLSQLNYSKEKISLAVYVSRAAEKHVEEVKDYLEDNADDYRAVKIFFPDDDLGSYGALTYIMRKTGKMQPDYVFILEATVHLTNPDVLAELVNKKRNVVGPLLKTDRGTRTNIMTEYIKGHFLQGPIFDNYISKPISKDGEFNFIGLLQVPMIKGAVLLSHQTSSSVQFSEEKPKGNFWNFFYQQLLKQGFIPYASNEVKYGYLINEAEGATSDLWNLDLNERAFLTFYLRPPSDVTVENQGSSSDNLDEPSSQGMCSHLTKEKVFKSHFREDLLQDVEVSSWRVVAGKETEAETFQPPENFARLQNLYVQSIVRYFTRNRAIHVPESGGQLTVIRGPGQFTLRGSMAVVMSLGHDQEESELEFEYNKTKDEAESPSSPNSSFSSSCIMKFCGGQATFVTALHLTRVKLLEPRTVLLFSL